MAPPTHNFGSSHANWRRALGRNRDSRYAPRASGVTGTTARFSATASKIALAAFSGG